MRILKAKVTKDNTLVATFKNEHDDTVTIEGKNLVTKDLLQTFSALVPHITFLCEKREAYRLERMDELPSDIYTKLDGNGQAVGGSANQAGLKIIG